MFSVVILNCKVNKNHNNQYFFDEKHVDRSIFFISFAGMNTSQPPVERHPWPPYIPEGARYLFLGTFPPKPERWSMPFFYPNKINDFWRVMGIIFYDNRDALWDAGQKRFDLKAIQSFLNREKIALWDTAMAVRRLKDNASDKFLDIVEPIDLAGLLDTHPTIQRVITTGEKATGVVAMQADIEIPAIGMPVTCQIGTHQIELLRMPSTSRAYPLALDKKAEAYRKVFEEF